MDWDDDDTLADWQESFFADDVLDDEEDCVRCPICDEPLTAPELAYDLCVDCRAAESGWGWGI